MEKHTHHVSVWGTAASAAGWAAGGGTPTGTCSQAEERGVNTHLWVRWATCFRCFGYLSSCSSSCSSSLCLCRLSCSSCSLLLPLCCSSCCLSLLLASSSSCCSCSCTSFSSSHTEACREDSWGAHTHTHTLLRHESTWSRSHDCHLLFTPSSCRPSICFSSCRETSWLSFSSRFLSSSICRALSWPMTPASASPWALD